MDHKHQDNHSNHSHNISGKNIGIAIFLNLIITIAQIIGGILSGSIALLNDSKNLIIDH